MLGNNEAKGEELVMLCRGHNHTLRGGGLVKEERIPRIPYLSMQQRTLTTIEVMSEHTKGTKKHFEEAFICQQ